MKDQVLYSTASPLNRGGMGTIAWHASRALQQAGLLARVLAPEVGGAGELSDRAQGLPWAFERTAAVMNRLGWHSWKDSFFDRWASEWLEPGMHFYGWLHQSLASIRRCRKLGGRTFVDRGSVEPRLQQRWLMEEYARHGLTADPIAPASVRRMVEEAEEVDVIVTPSVLVADSYVGAGYRECKIRVNPLGIDTRMFKPPENCRREGGIRFVFVGQLSIQKGLPDLLLAWKRLALPRAELVLAGVIPPKERSVIEPLLKGAVGVTWNGHCEQVPRLLQECDVLILPSAQDGFGSVVLEAMACGLPVIISDRVGSRDAVREGENGFVFPFGRRNILEERMHWFAGDRTQVEGMRKAARETAERYSWESYGRRLVSMIQQRIAS